MLKNRVIPVLLLKSGELVKTRRFQDAKYIGDPINAIKIFNEKEVDELLVLDINASKERNDPDYKTIELFASECFMPLCYGGGINTLEQAAKIFDLGVEKICLQSAAIDNPGFISQLARKYGSQSIVVSIDIKKNWRKKDMLYRSSSSKCLSYNWVAFAKDMANAGAGEIIINSVDNDGELCGYNLKLISEATQMLSVPIVALGGARSINDFTLAIKAGASAVGAGAMFVFHGPHRAVLITYPAYETLQAALNV
jgi:cyclase